MWKSAGTIWMKVKCLDRELGRFIKIFASFIVLFALFAMVTAIIQEFFTVDIYKGILNILIIVMAVLFFFLIICASLTVYAYLKKDVKTFYIIPVKAGLKFLIPLAIFLAGIIGRGEDEIRRFYIEVNNIMVKSNLLKYDTSDILILLPHCLQNSECEVKITGGIEKCKRCGKCDLDRISKISGECDVKAVVVTGGTAARKLIKDLRPKLVLSIACERDLVSGIYDVKNVPVLGVLNKRPNGPCFNTRVIVEEVKKYLGNICGVKTKDE